MLNCPARTCGYGLPCSHAQALLLLAECRNELVALDLFVTCVTGGFTFVGCVSSEAHLLLGTEAAFCTECF